MGVQRMRVRVLGGFAVDGIDSGRLGSRKARTLFKRLVLARGRPVSVDALAETLWPDQRPAKPAVDQSTVAWVHYCTRRASEARLLVVLGRRPDEGPAYRADQTITLGPLDLAATATIVGHDGAAELYARTGGHPLFLIELSRSGPDDVLPGSITSAVVERADRAGPAAATLRAAAVLGADIDLDLLAGVLQRPAAELLDDLEEGARRHLLVERMIGFSFPHQLIREALLAATGANRRALLHREAARWLAARPGAETARHRLSRTARRRPDACGAGAGRGRRGRRTAS